MRENFAMELLQKYNKALALHLDGVVTTKEPAQLYEPIQYILTLGGKRLRPVLTLLTADFFGNDYKEAMNGYFEWRCHAYFGVPTV